MATRGSKRFLTAFLSLTPFLSGRVGGGLDYHHWSAILRAVSALRAYHWIYRDRIQPRNVAELLPRSMRACYDQIVDNLRLLEGAYRGRAGECHRLAGELHTAALGDEIERFCMA